MSDYIFENENWGGAKCSLTKDGVLTINTDGGNVVADNSNYAPWKDNSVDVSKITKVDIKGLVGFNKGAELTGLFYGFNNCELFNGLTNLDVSEVTDMDSLFYMTIANKKLVKLNVSNWNATKVINLSSMFCRCSGLTELDLSNWNIAIVQSMFNMFESCTNLKTIKLNNITINNYLGLD